jgi:hypothetical protein
MKKVINQAIAYVLWIADLAVALWFAYLCRYDLLSFLAQLYMKGMWSEEKQLVVDRAFTILLGLGWLAFMIIVEEYFRVGVQKGGLWTRFARVTGPLVLAVFGANLILFWLRGISSNDWLHWIILAAELAVGITLTIMKKTRVPSKST